MGRPSKYHLMSVAEKAEHTRQHVAPDRCPDCHQAVMPADEEKHAERCEGRPPPGPRSKWLRLSEAVALGVPKRALLKLAEGDRVRTKGEVGQRRYLKRDIHKFKANQIRRERRRAQRAAVSAAVKDGQKALTMVAPIVPNRRMATDKDLKARVSAFIERSGSFAAASRRLDIPIKSLQRAAKGEAIRKGTQVLIEAQLAGVEE